MLAVLVRRWFVVLPLLLLTVAGTILAAVEIPTSYTSAGTISLLQSKKASAAPGVDNNPFLGFGTTLNVTADLLSRVLASDEAATQLRQEGFTAQEYRATLADNALGPFVTLTVTDPSPAKVSQ